MLQKSLPIGDVLVVVAHPDDESFGCGSTIAHAVAAGSRVRVLCATLGEAGEVADGYELAGRTLAEVRHAELLAAAAALGATCLPPLELRDSGFDGPAEPGTLCALGEAELAARLRATLAAERPDVVLTLAGDDGHRDHRHLAAATRAAVAAARAQDRTERPIELFEWCLPNQLMRRWAEHMSRLRPDTAHLALELGTLGTAPERCTTVIDTTAQLPARRAAVAAHASQTSPYAGLPDELATAFLTTDHLIRIG
jgi:LmbE family N-acetylglucosaminyl deacetylase